MNGPELIVTGVNPQIAARALNGMGEMIRAGERFTPDSCLVDLAGKHTHLSEVHPRHFESGAFAAWVDYYACLGPPHPAAEALEVVLPGRTALLASPRPSIG